MKAGLSGVALPGRPWVWLFRAWGSSIPSAIPFRLFSVPSVTLFVVGVGV
jgi:hypothetical protein